MSWILRDGIAVSQDSKWITTIDLTAANPTFSIRSTAEDANALTLSIAPIDLDSSTTAQALALTEAYVRQRDLIAQFLQREPWRFGYQVDFREMETASNDNSVCVELWVSVQTALLDSHPQVEVRFAGAELRSSDQGIFSDKRSRLGILIHPLDHNDCTVSCNGKTTTMKVFGRFMEKGVIRRMRFRVIATSAESSQLFWKEQLAEFASSPLPLTT